MNEPNRDPALRHDPEVADSPAELRTRLAEVRALVIDIDGVLQLAGRAIPGAPEALAELDQRGIPWRILTNTSTASRPTLSERLARLGLAVPPERITTSLSAAAAYTAERFPGEPLFVIAARAALPEFDGQRLLSAEETDAPDARAAAVVIGDGGDDLSYQNLNRAFRLVRGGAALLAMHRNAWWLTERGPTLDIGGYVVGLEFATGARAIVTGKPSPLVFRQAAGDLVRQLAAMGVAPTRRAAVAMVGDDVQKDILASRRAGLRAILVLSGNDGGAELRAATRGRDRVADGVATSFAAAVAALR
ncbi:MAG: HAD-IIA family hydrolase [Chloroflexi bacterium]|nr:HAD-IIA family hydrolase [Chloroflexota bacterium]